jgi:hypothetical protein
MTDIKSYPRTDIIPAAEVWVEVLSTRDSLGRVQFAASRADGNQWRGGTGISSQVSFRTLASFTAECEAEGYRVRVLTATEAVVLANKIHEAAQGRAS